MTKKQLAAISTAVVAVLGSAAAGLQGLSTASETRAQVKVLEVLRVEDSERLKRIEDKIDRLVETRR